MVSLDCTGEIARDVLELHASDRILLVVAIALVPSVGCIEAIYVSNQPRRLLPSEAISPLSRFITREAQWNNRRTFLTEIPLDWHNRSLSSKGSSTSSCAYSTSFHFKIKL